MKAKSSEAIDGAMPSRTASPATPRAASSATPTSAAVFTVAGYFRSYFRSTDSPKLRATPAQMSPIRASIRSWTWGVMCRVQPASRASDGSTFHASPPCISVIDTTATSSGSIMRPTIAWHCDWIADAAVSTS